MTDAATCRIAGLAAAFCSLLSHPASSRTYYVSNQGADSNDGLTVRSSFSSLQKASAVSRPGDVIYAMSGTYRSCDACDVLSVTQSGTASAPISYKAFPGNHPVIDFSNAWQGIHIDAAYITIDGFELVGGARRISYDYAFAHRNDLSSCVINANGIMIDNTINGTLPHHVTITHNQVHDAPGNGIEAAYADYIVIRRNRVFGNANWSPYSDSGISLYALRDSDHRDGYRNLVLQNTVYANMQRIPDHALGKITDGNGIIIDDNMNTQSSHVPYHGRTLVADNVSYLNGGSGIHAFSSQHVDIVANTTFRNQQTSSIDLGEIYAFGGSDIYILNNIMYARAGKRLTSRMGDASSVIEDHDVLFGGRLPPDRASNDVVGDPAFMDPDAGDFSLRASSAGRSKATPMLEPAFDFRDVPRAPGQHGDVGAYQFQPGPPE